MQSPTTSSLSAQSTTETASEVDLTTDNYSTLIDSVDETTLGTYPVFNKHSGYNINLEIICNPTAAPNYTKGVGGYGWGMVTSEL